VEKNIFQESLSKKLLDKEGKNQFCGVVLVRQEGGMLYSGAYGYANRTWGIKNAIDTKFRIGSISKMFTAVAILKLVEDGQIDLHNMISSYIDIEDSLIPKEVTVYQLLTHTSGIGDYYDEMISTDDDWLGLWKERPIYSMKSLQDYYSLFKNQSPAFKPGEKFHYNSAGYILLGMLIEKNYE